MAARREAFSGLLFSVQYQTATRAAMTAKVAKVTVTARRSIPIQRGGAAMNSACGGATGAQGSLETSFAAKGSTTLRPAAGRGAFAGEVLGAPGSNAFILAGGSAAGGGSFLAGALAASLGGASFGTMCLTTVAGMSLFGAPGTAVGGGGATTGPSSEIGLPHLSQ